MSIFIFAVIGIFWILPILWVTKSKDESLRHAGKGILFAQVVCVVLVMGIKSNITCLLWGVLLLFAIWDLLFLEDISVIKEFRAEQSKHPRFADIQGHRGAQILLEWTGTIGIIGILAAVISTIFRL